MEKSCWAVRSRRAVCIFLAIAILAALGDLLSKHIAFETLLTQPDVELRVRTESQRLAEIQNPNIPDADSPEFTRLVLMYSKIHSNVCPGVDLTLSTNPGVVFGFDAIPDFVVALVTMFMIVVVLVFFATSPRGAYWLQVGFALILAGALGNLYDRLFSSVELPGLTPITHHVRDFIDCSELGYPYIFNVADAWLVIGVAMVILWHLRQTCKECRQRKAANS